MGAKGKCPKCNNQAHIISSIPNEDLSAVDDLSKKNFIIKLESKKIKEIICPYCNKKQNLKPAYLKGKFSCKYCSVTDHGVSDKFN